MTESVWDYPRPPRVESGRRRIRVLVSSRTIIDTTDAVRVLETSHPPAWYLPFGALRAATLEPAARRTVCEFKRRGVLLDAAGGRSHPARRRLVLSGTRRRLRGAGDRFAVYPGRLDACYVDDERVHAQEGDFYGGWITSDISGPLKGGPGTLRW